jgi:hypothetical protein
MQHCTSARICKELLNPSCNNGFCVFFLSLQVILLLQAPIVLLLHILQPYTFSLIGNESSICCPFVAAQR